MLIRFHLKKMHFTFIAFAFVFAFLFALEFASEQELFGSYSENTILEINSYIKSDFIQRQDKNEGCFMTQFTLFMLTCT